MGFLWQLLPGAREARNQVIVGYAWLLALGLWFGVPQLTPGSNLAELAAAVGPVGTGIALSFLAFLLGSVFDDMSRGLIRRYEPQVPRTLLEFSSQKGFGQSQLERSETVSEVERVQASLDRLTSEIQSRLGLGLPAIVIGVNAWLAEWYWGMAVGVAVILLGWQLHLRSKEVKQAALDMERL